jgi:hypothetical protein
VVNGASFKQGEGRAYIALTTGVFHRLPEDEAEVENKLKTAVPLPGRLLACLGRRHRLGTDDWVVTWNGRRSARSTRASPPSRRRPGSART